MLALAVGGVHPIMLPAAAISIAVYASAFAWIGIYCSLHARTTLRATMFAILASVFLGGGYFLVLMFCCGLPLELARVRLADVRLVIEFLMGFSPPVNIFWLPIHELSWNELTLGRGPREVPYVPFWVIGLLAWAALSFLLSVQCVHKFRRIANRIPVPDEHLRLHKRPPPLPASRPGRG
jgi:hypothetical protein